MSYVTSKVTHKKSDLIEVNDPDGGVIRVTSENTKYWETIERLWALEPVLGSPAVAGIIEYLVESEYSGDNPNLSMVEDLVLYLDGASE